MGKNYTLLFWVIFILFSWNGYAQDITPDNYFEKFKESGKLILKEDYQPATVLLLQLNNFLKERKDLSKDSINHLYSKNYYNLCNIYLFEDFEKSVLYADSSIVTAERTNNPGLKQRAYSIKYYALYDIEGEEEALDFIADKCIQYSLEAKNDKMLGESYMHKCNSLVVLGKSNEALSYCNLAVATFEKISEPKYLSSVYNNIGNVFTKIDDHEKALNFYEKSHELSIIANGSRDIALSARNIAEKNELLGRWEIAAKNYKVFGDSTESYYKRLVESKFTEAEEKYNSELKDKEIAQQQLEIARQKNTRNLWIFGSFAALLLGFGVFQWRSQQQKRRKLLVEAELQKEQEINEIRSKFLGNIAHEIRTPLTLISGNLNLALEHLKDATKVEENIKTALQNSTKVTEDANEILELLRYEKDKTKITNTPLFLKETLSRIVFSFESLATMKEIEIKFTNNVLEDYKTSIDLEKLEKIINNLMSNAIKFSPSNSIISVAAGVHNSVLDFIVKDEGEGIHFDEKEKIFERFYQAKNNTTIGGIGIGLSLSREFAELLNGSLNVESELGKGSAFALKLPVPKYEGEIERILKKEKVSKPVDESENEATKTTTQKQKPKILITEDNPQMARFLEDILAPNYDCHLAFDGVEALEQLKKSRFDLITSDIMMPRMDGFAFREAVNNLPNYKHTPFILISAKTLEEDKIRGFTLGIDDYIIKPFNKEELLARVKNLITNYQSREQWKVENKNLLSDTTSADEKLLQQIENTVLENLNNEDFTVQHLAESANYSQRQLTRIMKQYTGMTPIQFILEIRLQKAYQLLQHKTHFTLSEVRYDVGISSSPYFNKKFKERFGVSPSALLS